MGQDRDRVARRDGDRPDPDTEDQCDAQRDEPTPIAAATGRSRTTAPTRPTRPGGRTPAVPGGGWRIGWEPRRGRRQDDVGVDARGPGRAGPRRGAGRVG